MYFVPDGTQICGFYECKDCGSRFLDLRGNYHGKRSIYQKKKRR
jgi:hypothetical protein